MKGGGGGWVNFKVLFEVLMVILFARLKEIVICRIFFTKFTLPKKNFQFELVESRFLELPVVKHYNITPNFSNQFASPNVFQKVWFHCMCKPIFMFEDFVLKYTVFAYLLQWKMQVHYWVGWIEQCKERMNWKT